MATGTSDDRYVDFYFLLIGAATLLYSTLLSWNIFFNGLQINVITILVIVESCNRTFYRELLNCQICIIFMKTNSDLVHKHSLTLELFISVVTAICLLFIAV